MSAADRVLGKAEAVLQVAEETLAELRTHVDEVGKLRQRLEYMAPDVERLRDIVPDIETILEKHTGMDWMTTTQVADHLQIHRDSITRMARDGLIPAHRVGESDHWRFDRREIDRAVRGLPPEE